ncbi:MAG TPA: aminopeptidase [Flavobacteriales bacterium]|nr:aminopeptidase [Flavobacteriales bacterium]|tara:strand:+ start:20815 stop:22011 length:1197 start_codon:yes stop_codon:yes gene_type:complete
MKKIILSLSAAFFIFSNATAQSDTLKNKKDGHYYFTVIKNNETTEVQNQWRTGTCWSFSSLSFIESELIRTGKGKHNLSEMFIVHNAYIAKAERYVRMHGKMNFSQGGAFHDIPFVIKNFGIVPESVYLGLNYGEEHHNHSELEAVLKGMLDAVIKNKQRHLTTAWKPSVEKVLDTYLGEIPKEFEYEGKKYTPQSYAKHLGLNMDDYVEVTSFTHHPFYESFVLEVPDNWVFGSVYNVPLDELMEIMEYAIMNGYTVAWGADVSEKGFSFRDGLAIVPKDPSTIKTKGKDSKYYNNAGAEKQSDAFDAPVEELEITQEMRQKAFDNYETTDDHGMHIVGMVKDQNGTKYFVVKNSWGTKNDCDGYFYASEAYFKYKTIDIMLHKDAIPPHLRKKLGF